MHLGTLVEIVEESMEDEEDENEEVVWRIFTTSLLFSSSTFLEKPSESFLEQ
jgi:hypothetical protein